MLIQQLRKQVQLNLIVYKLSTTSNNKDPGLMLTYQYVLVHEPALAHLF